MKTVFSFFATILFSTTAFSQSPADLTCRAEAKKTALETYTLCIDRHNEARSKELNNINQEYQKEAAALKAKYEARIQNTLAGSSTAQQSPVRSTVAPVRTRTAVAAPKASTGVPRQLPVKATANVENLQVQSAIQGTKVITVDDAQSLEIAEGLVD